MTTGRCGVTITEMKAVGRFGLIALTIVLLSAPAGAACEALGEWMAGCHDMTMPGCSDEIALSSSCCGPSLSDSETDLVLKRPGEDDVLLMDVALQTVANAATVIALRPGLPEYEPPARPPRYALFSTLLL